MARYSRGKIAGELTCEFSITVIRDLYDRLIHHGSP